MHPKEYFIDFVFSLFSVSLGAIYFLECFIENFVYFSFLCLYESFIWLKQPFDTEIERDVFLMTNEFSET